MSVYQKTMFDRYYCITSFCHLKNTSKSSFLYYYNDAQKHEGFVGFENGFSKAKTYIILTSLNYIHFFSVDDIIFCDGLECVCVKYKSRASTACEVPD